MNKKRIGLAVGIIAAALACFFIVTRLSGCARQKGPPPTDIVAVNAPDCPPDAKHCPTTQESVVPGFGPDSKTIGKLVEPVKARVLVTDDRLSDPRVISMDVPSGTWLVDDGKGTK